VQNPTQQKTTGAGDCFTVTRNVPVIPPPPGAARPPVGTHCRQKALACVFLRTIIVVVSAVVFHSNFYCKLAPSAHTSKTKDN